jgi:glycosyltransferase involved in cell wall biosynthesis
LIKNYNIRENKIRVINNWIKVPTQPKSQKIVYDLIYLGRISAQKRPLMLIDVVEDLLKHNKKEVKICIIGHGELVPKLLKYIKEKKLSKHVSFLGTKKNIFKYLYRSKMFILPSRYEGEPIAVLEAMACGLPVVMMGYKGAAGLIKDGVNGYICKDSKEFVSKIKYLLENSKVRKRMGAQARDFVESKRSHANLESFVSHLIPS